MYKHGLWKHPLYKTWGKMKERCYNQKYKSYKNYGGRGITVCEEWKHDPKTFVEWCLAHGWQKGLLIDRRDNEGNYSPDNCRFVDAGLSARNKRLLRSDNTSGYVGVSFHKKDNKYQAHIAMKGERKYLGEFTDPMSAAIAYDSVAVVLNDGRPTNFKWSN